MREAELIHRTSLRAADMAGLIETHQLQGHVIPANDQTAQIEGVKLQDAAPRTASKLPFSQNLEAEPITPESQ
jgi:hypothetical protein